MVAWKWSAPIYYYFICCWLLHCFSSCQLIWLIVVCPTSWLYFVVWYDGVAARDKNWREGRRVGRRSTNDGRLRWRSAECLPCPRPRATNRTTNLRDPPYHQLIVVFKDIAVRVEVVVVRPQPPASRSSSTSTLTPMTTTTRPSLLLQNGGNKAARTLPPSPTASRTHALWSLCIILGPEV